MLRRMQRVTVRDLGMMGRLFRTARLVVLRGLILSRRQPLRRHEGGVTQGLPQRLDRAGPIAELLLTKQPRGRVPRAVAALAQPAKIGGKRQQQKERLAHQCQARGRRRTRRPKTPLILMPKMGDDTCVVVLASRRWKGPARGRQAMVGVSPALGAAPTGILTRFRARAGRLYSLCPVSTLLPDSRGLGPRQLSPGRWSCLIQYARRLLRRDVDGPIRRPRADGRRLEGGRDGPRSRRPAPTSSGRRASDGGGAAARPRGSRPRRSPARGGAESQRVVRDTRTPPTRVPKGNPLRRA